jgi:hypothetical protein
VAGGSSGIGAGAGEEGSNLSGLVYAQADETYAASGAEVDPALSEGAAA